MFTTGIEEGPLRGPTVTVQALGNPRGLKPAARSGRGIERGHLEIPDGVAPAAENDLDLRACIKSPFHEGLRRPVGDRDRLDLRAMPANQLLGELHAQAALVDLQPPQTALLQHAGKQLVLLLIERTSVGQVDDLPSPCG